MKFDAYDPILCTSLSSLGWVLFFPIPAGPRESLAQPRTPRKHRETESPRKTSLPQSTSLVDYFFCQNVVDVGRNHKVIWSDRETRFIIIGDTVSKHQNIRAFLRRNTFRDDRHKPSAYIEEEQPCWEEWVC